ncbi:MAG: hypothetical protein QOD99_2825 [Chthoniobacter sp.]|jgi:hypothetical protein|nr:hypothetical protein [Chthoniobacter sp.]
MLNIYSLNAGQLDELGNNMEDGLTQLGVSLKINQITPGEIAAQVAAFLEKDNLFNAGRTARQEASDAVQGKLGALADWLGVVKGVLTSSFGQRWSSQWVQVGFITPSLALPGKSSEQYSLATRMIAFFTGAAKYEVPEVKATAAEGTALQAAITGAKKTLKEKDLALKDIGTAWDAAYNALTKTMISLIKILEGSLDGGNDPRWLVFGLPMPSTPSTPGQPVALTAEVNAAGNIVVACDAVPLASRYRFRMRIVGAQSEYKLAASSPVPMGAIAGVEPGQTVEIIVQAVNGSLQGVASEPILFTLPVAAKMAEVKLTEVAHHTNGNGAPVLATAEALNGNHRR